MRLKLKNIGLLKEANIKLDGLTIIAGENDTGKSTVGKALMNINLAHHQANNSQNNFWLDRNNAFIRLSRLLFDNQIESFNSNESNITLSNKNDKTIYEVDINNGQVMYANTSINERGERACDYFIFIESAFIWDMMDFFNSINYAQSQSNIFDQHTNLSYPFLAYDMYGLLINPRQFANKNIALVEEIKNIINGEFKKDSFGKYYFSRQNEKGFENAYSLINVASGIKYFGIIQSLLNNNHLHKDFIIIDEPENNLHPKWHLKLAEIIVKLSKFNTIIVNSHSPYMIEALQKYSNIEGLKEKTNFYLAKDGVIKDESSLDKIFTQLSEPYDTFDEMDKKVLLSE